MAEFDPFASGQAVLTDSPREEFDPFASGEAVAVSEPKKQEAFDPFAEGKALAIEDTSMVDRLEGRLSPERQLPAESLQRVEQARIKAIEDAPEPTLLVRLKENIKSGWSNSTIGSLLESIQEPLANEPLELRRQRATVDRLAREKARRGGADVLSDPTLVELPDKALDSEIEKQGKRLLDQVEKSAPETKARIAEREKALTETAKRIGAYQAVPDFQGPVEGLASLTGQIVGSLADPANLVAGPEVRLARNATRLGRVANQFVGQGIGGAVGNLAVEPLSQANRIRTGELDQFSPVDAAKGAALGFVAGGVLGAAPEAIKRAPVAAPKKPSLVEQMDSSTHGTPTAANVAANDIAMQSPEPVVAPPPAPVAPRAPEPTPEVKVGPVETEILAQPAGDKKIALAKEAIKDPGTEIKYSVWPAEMIPEGRERTVQVDLINEPLAVKLGEQPGIGLGSVPRALLEELGVDAPKAPDWLPPGSYTLGEIKAAIEQGRPDVKTKAQLIKDILKSNPDSDIEAPKQLLASGKYVVQDIPIESIGEVFGKLTIQPKVVAEYVKSPPKDPIILAKVDGELRPVDGKHRLTAAIQRGDKTIKAWVAEKDLAQAPDIQGAKDYYDELLATREITPEEHAEKIAELNQNQNAVQIQSPEGLPVRQQAEASPQMGSQIRNQGQAQEVVTSPVDAPPSQATIPDDAPPAQAGGGSGGAVPPGQVAGPSPSFNNPIPNYGWTPFVSSSDAGKFIKEKIGTIGGNIRKADPEVFGALLERGFKINELKFDWSNASRDYGNLGRRVLKPEAFTELDRLLQSGLHKEAAQFIKGSRYEAELTQAINKFKTTLDALRQAEINAGREVGSLNNYWIRQVADYEGLRKELGRDPSNAAERALKAAAEQKKRALTPEEEEQVINNLISTSFSGQGKPGFLNARTIGEIQKNWFKYYEPSDVAIEQRINRVATDVVDRAYFGKFTPEGLAQANAGNVGAIEGSFGEIIRRHLADGSLSPEASRVVVRNLQDFLRSESGFNEVNSRLATAIRKAQTYGYLSDLSSAIPQFGDFFLTSWRNGFLDTAKGYTNRKLTLGDIKLHQGTPDTVIYSKRNREGLAGKVFRNAVQLSIGIADGFNKGGSINTSFHEAVRDMRDPSSETYKRLDRKWSERFPNRWPDIKKDLQSDAFRNGDLNPNTQFFLYSELADHQPISGESYAQGYHQAGPFGKILYGLKSFAIKQLDVMREAGYEQMRSKDASVRAEGLKNLVTYALVVGIGQQFLSSYMRDVLFSRESSASDYALSGLFSLVGLNRYLIYRSGDVGVGTATLETLVPGVGIVNDAGQSARVALQGLTGQRNKTTGMRTVPDIPTALSKMQAIKYVPFIGRSLDAYLGPGASREKKKAEDKAKGKPQKTTIQQIEEALIPPDVAR